MSALRPPGLGPVIGHTTGTTSRLWIQAAEVKEDGVTLESSRRTVGVLGVLTGRANNLKVSRAYYFRLQREFDRTGTFVLGADVSLGRYHTDEADAKRLGLPFQAETPEPLTPDTEYRVRMATLSIDDPAPDDESITDVELARRLPPIDHVKHMLIGLDPSICETLLHTFPERGKVQDKLTFLLGSCRYPGLLWKAKEADKIFDPMQRMLAEGQFPERPRFSLMVGDQIYADTLNRLIPIGLADTYEEFQERYQSAYGSPNMRQLLKTAPTYMTLDDHEIEDNWSQDRLSDNGKHQLFNLAIGAYMSYQWSPGPRTWGRLLYYRFKCAGYPFFVLDTRTQRFKDQSGLPDNHMLGRPPIDPVHPGQLKRLLKWLSKQQTNFGNVPKFVGCASVFAPNAMDERLDDPDPANWLTANAARRDGSDSWPAYPLTRRAILDHIVGNNIQNVVFLTGDIHCANIAELRFTKGGKVLDLRAFDITSSALYWPFPFANGDPNNYVHDSTQPKQRDPFPIDGGEMNYIAWAFTQEDNFCRISVDKTAARLDVTYHDTKGRPLQVADPTGTPITTHQLSLVPW